jgi:hypothetical protein
MSREAKGVRREAERGTEEGQSLSDNFVSLRIAAVLRKTIMARKKKSQD